LAGLLAPGIKNWRLNFIIERAEAPFFVMSVLKVGRAASLAGLFTNTAWLCFLSPVNIAKFSRNFVEIKINFGRSKAGQKYLSELFLQTEPTFINCYRWFTTMMREALNLLKG
jgi:hypothetical protein